LPADGDVQLAHAREIALPQPSRHVLLPEEDFPFRPGSRPPVLQPPLQRPQLAVGELARMLPLQCFEQCPRLQPRVRRDLFANPFPYLGERIGPRPPAPVFLSLTRQTRIVQIIPRRLPVHPGFRRRQFLILFCFRQPFQPPDLFVSDHF